VRQYLNISTSGRRVAFGTFLGCCASSAPKGTPYFSQWHPKVVTDKMEREVIIIGCNIVNKKKAEQFIRFPRFFTQALISGEVPQP